LDRDIVSREFQLRIVLGKMNSQPACMHQYREPEWCRGDQDQNDESAYGELGYATVGSLSVCLSVCLQKLRVVYLSAI